jgi:hypothetical protein
MLFMLTALRIKPLDQRRGFFIHIYDEAASKAPFITQKMEDKFY